MSLQLEKESSRRDLVPLIPSENYFINFAVRGIRSSFSVLMLLFYWSAVETIRTKSLNLRV